MNASQPYPSVPRTALVCPHLRQELLRAGIYSDVAVGLKGGPWRHASRVLMIQKLSKGMAPLDPTEEVKHMLHEFEETLANDVGGEAPAPASSGTGDDAVGKAARRPSLRKGPSFSPFTSIFASTGKETSKFREQKS